MFLGSISLEDVEELEVIFGKRTEQGWVIPDWLVYLREQVESRK